MNTKKYPLIIIDERVSLNLMTLGRLPAIFLMRDNMSELSIFIDESGDVRNSCRKNSGYMLRG